MQNIEEVSVKIIASAGDALAQMMQALDVARNGDFERADSLMEQASLSITEAHKVQTGLITQEAQGIKSEYSILMVHAQDHLMNAMLAQILIKEMIELYKKLKNISEGGKFN
ncbi:MAG: PTS lactose/cellobiose transporter subunit IIA [Tepidanaerobacter acetatoxydans]|uniref:PTS lactose/cellobiose transporter subunit IIA n=1 Tax=Tepidanaerobacter TaxID=499228 RepID=UPI000B0C560C|nr:MULTISPECIES: PTS lactose/cellobiose transporter subunit IIA [Tepidanaerobacter]NLU11577.1 PTS lactose/cellobiose transporter subunit IIA [Tepidanaerobacter acetatoxydans]